VDRYGVFVDHLGIGDRPEFEDEGKRSRVLVGTVLIGDAIEVEFHGVGVEFRPVVELDALTEFERVRLAVVADRPRCRKARFDIEGLVLVVQEALIHVAEDAKVADRHRLGGIEGLKFGDVPDHEHVFGRLRPRGRRHRHCDRQTEPGREAHQPRFVLHCRDAFSGEVEVGKPRLFKLCPEIERFR